MPSGHAVQPVVLAASGFVPRHSSMSLAHTGCPLAECWSESPSRTAGRTTVLVLGPPPPGGRALAAAVAENGRQASGGPGARGGDRCLGGRPLPEGPGGRPLPLILPRRAREDDRCRSDCRGRGIRDSDSVRDFGGPGGRPRPGARGQWRPVTR